MRTRQGKASPRGGFLAAVQRELPGMELTANALRVTSEGLSEGDYEKALTKLAQVDDGSRWWIGDLLVERGKRYGETYGWAVLITGRREKTLQDWRRIASRVEPGLRRPELKWSHYRELERLPSDDLARWAQRAIKEGWTSEDLKFELDNAWKNRRPDSFPDPEDGCVCPKCGGTGFIAASGVRLGMVFSRESYRRECLTCGGAGWVERPRLVAVT